LTRSQQEVSSRHGTAWDRTASAGRGGCAVQPGRHRRCRGRRPLPAGQPAQQRATQPPRRPPGPPSGAACCSRRRQPEAAPSHGRGHHPRPGTRPDRPTLRHRPAADRRLRSSRPLRLRWPDQPAAGQPRGSTASAKAVTSASQRPGWSRCRACPPGSSTKRPAGSSARTARRTSPDSALPGA
jgi:hypothetical protein